MNWLRCCASREQLQQFDEEGYLVVEDALSSDMVQKLTVVVDRIDAQERAERGLEPGEMMAKFRSVVADDLFLDLLDNEKTFPLLWDILGWNIQLYISHLIVYPPEPKDVDRRLKGLLWHQDGGRPVEEIERPAPRLSLKISYWLTDTTIPDCGAMRILPGSHRLVDKPAQRDPTEDPEGAIEIKVKPGTAVLFDRRMWHSRGYNYSNQIRKVLFFGYSYRWLRGLDYNVMPEEVLAKCDPIRRQLLGDGVDIKGWWQPTEEDVPLKTWIREHRGEEFLYDVSQRYNV
jgi:ectoine hydroxylase